MNRKSFIKSLSLSSIPLFMNSFQSLEAFTQLFPLSPKMPVLFIGHGSPMNAVEDNVIVQGFKKTASMLPKPNAILCISAHWYTKGTKVTVNPNPAIIYDFGGFPEELYQVKYPAAGSPELAHEVHTLLKADNCQLDDQWGLDHGVWTVLKHFYPLADVPVIQLSIDYTQSSEYHYNLAKKLKSLRERGVLIVGSGNIIHNLGLIDFANINKDNYGYDWAIEAHQTFNELILKCDHTSLINYQNLGKFAALSIPTPDHYLPLLYTLALQEKEESISLFNDKLVAGSLNMTSVKIG